MTALEGRRVLVTRGAERGGEIAAGLERNGARVELRPTFRVEATLDHPDVARTVRAAESYDWILFTSVNGVRFFVAALSAAGKSLGALPARIGAVGSVTARAVVEAGAEVAAVPADARAEGLAAELEAQGVSGMRVLVVRPETGRAFLPEELGRQGALVDTLVVYRNQPASGVATVVRDLAAGGFHIAVWTSPSAWAWVADACRAAGLDPTDVVRRVASVAIGEVTAARLREDGVNVAAVAREASAGGVVEAVLRCANIAAAAPQRARQEAILSSKTAQKKTPLHDEHVAAGGRMVDFAGWRMAVQFEGLIAEHMAVRTRAGLFDVSHMGEAIVAGPEALEFLQRVTCNNVARLEPGRAHYTALTTPEGCFVDDLLIYCLGENKFFLVLNAGNAEKDLAWLARYAAGHDATVRDVSEEWAQLALQGPEAVAILAPRTRDAIAELRYYAFLRTAVDGVECIVSRTGYTGEDGFEIYTPAEAAPKLWRSILKHGAQRGVVPVGLGARDTLRLEAKMALYGNDIDDTTTVLEADLAWIVKFKKGDFVGRDVLSRQHEVGVARKLIGFEMRGRAIPRQGYAAFRDDREVGRVTSGTFAPFLKKGIGLAYLPTELTAVDTEFEVEIRGRREAAVVVPTPFYKRSAG